MHAWRASFEARMDQMHDACMSAFHSRAWGLEEDVAAHVQWSEAAGKNKLTADEVNDIRGMLQVRGLLPPPIYVTLCICVCLHSYTNINTGTQARNPMMAFPLCVVIPTYLTTSKVSTWAVPATRPMETSSRQKSFQKPSVLSA